MKKRFAVIVLAGLVTLGAGWLAMAQEAAATNAPAATPLRVESNQTLWKLIKSGGWAMWPLGTCSVLTVTLIVLNFQRVGVKKMVPPVTVAEMKGAATSGDLQQLWNLASGSDNLFTRSMAAGLRNLNPDDPVGSRPKMEAAISETAGREESKYAFFVNFLALLTSMSPMWGLIGTVSGMIGAFTKIGAGGMGKPEMLAKNIGEALVCTASGLIIAITAMAFYFLFRNILNTVMKEAEAGFTEILDTLTGAGNTFAAAPAAEPETQASEKA